VNADPFSRLDLSVVIATIKRELENQITGTQTMLGNGDKPSERDVTDGTSNTILVVEAQRDVPLTKPEDIPFDPKLPLPQIGGFTPDGANVLFGDGSVRYIRKTISPAALKALITRAGGEVIRSDAY